MTHDLKHLEMVVYQDGAVIAAASSILVARAAFYTAVRLYPDATILLRHRARIIDKSPPDEPAKSH